MTELVRESQPGEFDSLKLDQHPPDYLGAGVLFSSGKRGAPIVDQKPGCLQPQSKLASSLDANMAKHVSVLGGSFKHACDEKCPQRMWDSQRGLKRT